jgi:hypothetical protein
MTHHNPTKVLTTWFLITLNLSPFQELTDISISMFVPCPCFTTQYCSCILNSDRVHSLIPGYHQAMLLWFRKWLHVPILFLCSPVSVIFYHPRYSLMFRSSHPNGICHPLTLHVREFFPIHNICPSWSRLTRPCVEAKDSHILQGGMERPLGKRSYVVSWVIFFVPTILMSVLLRVMVSFFILPLLS